MCVCVKERERALHDGEIVKFKNNNNIEVRGVEILLRRERERERGDGFRERQKV